MHDELIARLLRAPATVRQLTRRMRGDALTRAADGEWSARDVVLHLRASDAIIAPRIMQILVRERPPLAGFDEQAWAAVLAGAEVPLDAQLAAYAVCRTELVGVLRRLDDAQWQRAGVHEERGELRVLDICEWLAEHEAEHIAQLEAIVAGKRE
jgi:hypothetical protein